MIDPLAKDLISLKDAAELANVTYQCAWLWVKLGSHGVILEAIRKGGRWFTSEQALRDFFERTNPQQKVVLPRTPAQARRAHRDAVQRLREAGC